MLETSLKTSVFTVSYLDSLVRVYEALDILVRHKRINSEIAEEVKTFLKSNPASIPLTAKTESDERTSKINEVMCRSLS